MQMYGNDTFGTSSGPGPLYPSTSSPLLLHALRSPFLPSPFLTAPSATMLLSQTNNADPADVSRPTPSKKCTRVGDGQPGKRRKQTVKVEGTKNMCPYPGCKRFFSRKFNLGTHMMTHTGEKPYMCGFCGNKFSRKHDLKRHTMIHTGEQRQQCLDCLRTFVRADKLACHKIKCKAMQPLV